MNTNYPLCAFENLEIQEAGAEIIVFDSKAQAFHLLNPTAYSILKACNGSNTIRDIAVTLASKFDIEDVDSVETDVTETVKSFEAKGLMWYVTHEAPVSTIDSDESSEGPLIAISVTGASMFPVLLSGDKVLVKRSSLAELSIGDIVVWADETNHHVAHRIVSIDTSSTPALITTKGDVTLQSDWPVEFRVVLGKVVAALRDGELIWIKELESNKGGGGSTANQPRRRPSYKELKVLDLREVSVESIQNIESVENVGLVLLSPENAHAWSQVPATHVKAVYTAPSEYRVYTGQPEILPEILEFLEEPLRLIVLGQLFLTGLEPQQIEQVFRELIVIGQVYVSSVEAKTAVESIAKTITGGVSIVPAEHARWIGESILGPEYLSSNHNAPPLVAIGDLSVSDRMKEIPNEIALYR